ncbi:THO complex subunit 2-like isoform X2 [Mizuhopecten yessoensis]|uniref:THO complex subunit 2 n=1 Tax=Mizuhopecten yessoensis TaxID=6573 RepID=A0A210QYV8_MIZYE|nr:THO complex subunit 2-like isoform X2 [Mizuhopecten yessoensis]OWF53939.1 THO complex subunit 2 [Mizuhopecten yessoensis]
MAVALHCKTWEKSGRTEFLKLCKNSAENNGLWSQGPKSLSRTLYDLCWQVIKGQLKPEQALSALGEASDAHKGIPSVLADVYGTIDIESSITEDKAQRERFISLVSACDIFVPAAVLKERLDQELLESCGLIPSKLQFQQKYVKTKTKLYYKQQKFNLLREESEGYAKLVTELNQEITDKTTYTQVLENLKSLIGCFDLDPNRVLDILLESFERRPELDDFYVPLFKEYVTEQKTLCHILGFKFHFFKEEETPASLYTIAALLLQNGLIDLDSLYPHLSPPDTKIREHHQKDIDDAKAYARKLSVVILSERSEDKKDDDSVKVDVHVTNQKLGLIEALLGLGAWDNAKQILDRLPEFFATTYKPIALALCALVHLMMDPVYRTNSGLPSKIMKSKVPDGGRFSSKVARAHTFRDLHQMVLPIMRYIGPYTCCDPILMVKIIRLGKNFMGKRQSGGISPDDEVAYYGFLNMLDEVLLPGMVLLPCNCCISEELWGFIKLFPYMLRYRLYGNWKNDTYSQHAKLIRARADCMERAKYIMKRLAKENVKPSGRQLGKLSHSNPGVVFEYVLSQIQRYDNFIGPVVDSLKYLTSLSYDVLAFCIIEAVANPEKDRMKYDDTNISLWLQSLANFTGSICRKYNIELAGVMQYVANQLKAGKSFDLLLLREVVQKMAGIEISEEITGDQLDAMSGGELLRQEGGYFSQVRNTKKSSTRLKDTLLEHDLALSLCLLIAQHRDGVIFHEGADTHLKLIGKLYDQCQDTLVQFGSFLSMQLSSEEFVKRLPDVDTLITTYHIPPDAAFFLCRPAFTYAINSKFDELRKIDKSNKHNSSQHKMQRYIEASEFVNGPVIELVRPLYTPKVWEDLSAPFFVTFWSLQMYDLAVPSNVYDKQNQQLCAQISAIEDNKDMPQSKKKKEKERCNTLMDKLKDEEKKQGEHVARVHNRLKNQKEQWFISRSTKNETITQFLQLCIFPRCCFTAIDALYCSKFIHILHDLKTPNFSTLICYDRIFCDITYTVTCCTENEAHRYGRFLCAALDTIMRWHSNKGIYEKECASYPGFVTVFRKGTDSNNKADQLDYENYRHVCHKWQFRITKAMVSCLESGKFIQIRNALIVLTKILQHYPRITQFGQALERRVDRLRQEEKDKRPDIYALAMGYSGQLKSKKSSWVQEAEFHLKDKEVKVNTKTTSATSKQSGAQAANGIAENGSKKTNGEVKSQSKRTENGEASSSKSKEPKESKEVKEKRSREPSEKKEKTDAKSKISSEKYSGNVEERREITSSSKKDKENSHKDKEEKSSKDKDKSHTEERVSKDRGHSSKEVKHLKEEDTEWVAKEDRGHSSKEEKTVRIKEEKVRIKDEARERKVEIKTEKPIKREDKHEKVKLKRMYETEARESSREVRDAGRDSVRDTGRDTVREYRESPKERDGHRERRGEEHHERASSVGSSGSHGSAIVRRSPDTSPQYADERDGKRRRLETSATPSNSKESVRSESRERHKRSPSQEREKERDRDRRDRKRDSLDDRVEVETKRRKSLEPSSSKSSSKVNGDAERHVSKSTEKQKHDKLMASAVVQEDEASPQRTKKDKEKSKKSDRGDKEKSKDKSSSSKKSKK